MMLINEVNKRLQQRPPFQMIDRVLEIEANESCHGIKCVSINEPYFMGHFPDTPIMPGVLIVESCAQLCSLVFDCDGIKDNNKVNVLLKVDGFKFVKAVIPGDTLHLHVKKAKVTGPLITFDCKVVVDDKVFAKGSLTFTEVDKESIYQR